MSLNLSHRFDLSYLSICLNLYIYLYLSTPPLGQDMTQDQFLSGV